MRRGLFASGSSHRPEKPEKNDKQLRLTAGGCHEQFESRHRPGFPNSIFSRSRRRPSETGWKNEKAIIIENRKGRVDCVRMLSENPRDSATITSHETP